MKRGNVKPAATAAFGAGPGPGSFSGSNSRSSLSYLVEPPSFTAVSDPQVVVAFKNVLKKDSTTKAKALEELVAYTQGHPYDSEGGVEDALLSVWVRFELNHTQSTNC